MVFKVLFIGDIVGRLARQALAKALPDIKKEFEPDLIIANGENAAHGSGITRKIFDELISIGIDCLTLGDHTFDKNEVSQLLLEPPFRLLRPANYPPTLPGKGAQLIEVGSKKILVVNLLGRVFMKMDYDCPFRKIDEILDSYKNQPPNFVIVDLHAEVTSEKVVFGWYVDGRVSAVIGTHTHIPTADAKILPGGTAYITDVGMVGAFDSVIGVKKESVIEMFLNQTPKTLEPVEEGLCVLNSVLIQLDSQSNQAISIDRVDKEIKI